MMTKNTNLRKHSAKVGLPPGTLVHVGEERAEPVKITVIDYDAHDFQEKTVSTVEECFVFKTTPTVTWINIDGIQQIDIIEKIGKNFDLHPLMLEDILSTGQRPKSEDYGDYIYIVIKMLAYDDGQERISSEQVSLVLGENFVISFQERTGDVFDRIRDRIRSHKGRIRDMACDYLAYSVVDAIIDHYFVILEKMGEKIDLLEERILTSFDEGVIHETHKLKRELVLLRKSVWPARELISSLQRSESSLIRQETGMYLRDVYDHTIQIIDTIDSFRDLVSGLVDIYLSSISNRMNAVMKVLTIIATIFIPLTFIAGIYGMNFKYMPELDWAWAYFAVLAVMGVVAGGMLVYFKKKKWL